MKALQTTMLLLVLLCVAGRASAEAQAVAGGVPTTQAALQQIGAALIASDITRNADGHVTGFTFRHPDPSGTRRMTLREYEPGVGGFPNTVAGRLTWQDVTDGPATIGYWYDDADGNRRPGAGGGFVTTGASGSAGFAIDLREPDARRLTVAIVCPGPGRFGVDLPGSLSPAARLTAWVAGRFWLIFGGLLAASVVMVVPLNMLAKRGRGRAAAMGFFGLLLATGVLEVFAAGVAIGMGRPASAWGPLLTVAAAAILIAGIMLPRLRRQYAMTQPHQAPAGS